ncbi:putative ribonuclease H-like domain-containing protein [Tanacetum coccineum]
MILSCRNLEDTVEVKHTGIFGSAYDDDLDTCNSPYADQVVGAEADFNNMEPSTTKKSSGEHVMISYIQKQRRSNHKDFQNCLFACFLSQHEPIKIAQALDDESWVEAMQEELLQFKIQKMDVKSAFLYGTIEEEVYVSQPLCFVDLEFPEKVYKVEKALYVLHQAPRAWYETLSTYLLDNRFYRGQIDKTLFIKRVKNDILLMSSMGELTFFLGLQVKQKEDGIFISQDKYVGEILKKFSFSSIRTASTPMKTNKALTKDEDGEDANVHLYRSMIRSLMYLTSSRPDIMFSVCSCSRFQVPVWTENPQQEVVNFLVQVLWIQNQMLDYGYNFMQTKIHVDNESAICVVKNPVYHSKTKHIEIRHHFIRDSYEKRLIEMVKIHTDNNVADLLTKAFDGRLMVYKCSGLYTSAIWIEVGRLSKAFLTFIHGLCIDMDPHEFSHVYLVIASVLVMNTTFVDQHNMVACLEKSEENIEFHQIVDFLSTCSINYALTAVVISESSVRSDLLFNDEDGITCLTNDEIFENLALMGYEQLSTKLTFQKGSFSP